jgi:large subunit ribosomal protein L7/L12
MPEITKEQVIDYLSNLSVMDIAALTKELEDKWGVKAAAAAVAMVAPAAGGGAAAADAAPTEFNVVLTSFGKNKIQVIKTLREVVTGLGLKEAKDLVEAVPKAIKEAVSKEEADQVAAKLKEAGGEVEVKPV